MGENSSIEDKVWQEIVRPAIEREGFRFFDAEGGERMVPPANMQMQLAMKGTTISRLIWKQLIENGRGIDYDGVVGQPNKSNPSRLTADVATSLASNIHKIPDGDLSKILAGNVSTTVADAIKLHIPVISANMYCVTEKKLAIELARHGSAGVIHQFFPSIDDQASQVSSVKETPVIGPISIDRLTFGRTLDRRGRYVVGAAVGVNNGNYNRAGLLVEAGADFIVIDIAHGHANSVIELVRKIKKDYKIPIIAGNIITPEAAYELCEAGASGLKVGIGPGDVCITGSVTSFGSFSSMLTAIKRVSTVAKKYGATVIADGGIKNSGHLAQTLAAGADIAMYGRRFAECLESPNIEHRLPYGGDIVNPQKLLYWGSASEKTNALLDHGKSNVAEGTIKIVDVNPGGAQQVLLDDRIGLGSSLSYAGAANLSEFRENSRWILR